MEPEKFKREMQARAEKLAAWLEVIDEAYSQVISRREETASLPGLDPEPREKLCEHKLAWRRKKLCVECGNTGWRRLTSQERKEDDAMRAVGRPREEWHGVDRYTSQVSSGVTIVKDESPAGKKARADEHLDAVLSVLERNTRIRANIEAPEDRALRDFRIVSSQPRVVRRIQKGLEVLRILRPELYDDLPGERGLLALATVMYHVAPGRIPLAT